MADLALLADNGIPARRNPAAGVACSGHQIRFMGDETQRIARAACHARATGLPMELLA
ncbi:hypothetical protein AAFN86_05795 [Roseomonas sp. CAU 1739]|uniref:hypothetical protein n=1 Tax=Roseomonas sp. CAU 1739 TaxID=3140364 RepID=UPI00325A46B0